MSRYEMLDCDSCIDKNLEQTKTLPFICPETNNQCVVIKTPRRVSLDFLESLYHELKELEINKDNQDYDTVRVPINRKYINKSLMDFLNLRNENE